MNFIIGQIFSAVALIIAVVGVQFKKVHQVLLGSMSSNIATALSYGFLGGLYGEWIFIVGAVQTLIIYLTNKYDLEKKKRTLLTILFLAVYVVGTVVVYQSWDDIIACACAVLYMMAIVQKNTAKYRKFLAANTCLWIVYDIAVMAYVNIITHGVMLSSLVIAMIRLDRENKNSK